MKPTFYSAIASSILLAAATLTVPSGSAFAGNVATRCDSYGCSRIVCNDTGDRCHRLYNDRYGDGYRHEDGYRSYYERSDDDRRNRESYYDRGSYARGWHYDCDRDADRCSVRRESSW